MEEEIATLTEKYRTNHYTTYLKGKKVLIVGPNTDLQGKGLGKEIDRSGKIVIRHNTVFEYLPFRLKSRYQVDYGSQTNVLYLAPQCIKDYSFDQETINKLKILKKRYGLRFICYQNGNKDGKYLTGTYCFQKHLNWWKRICPRLGIETHYSHHTARVLADLMSVGGEQSWIPRVGFLSVFDMLVHQVKELKILGMSFYQGGGHTFRKQALKKLDPLLNAYGKTTGCHNSIIELQMLSQWIKHPDKYQTRIIYISNSIPDEQSGDQPTSDQRESEERDREADRESGDREPDQGDREDFCYSGTSSSDEWEELSFEDFDSSGEWEESGELSLSELSS